MASFLNSMKFHSLQDIILVFNGFVIVTENDIIFVKDQLLLKLCSYLAQLSVGSLKLTRILTSMILIFVKGRQCATCNKLFGRGQATAPSEVQTSL